MTAKLLLVDAIFLLLNLQFAHASFSMKIPSGVEECFGLKIPENGAKAVVSGDFDCLDCDMENTPATPLSVIIYAGSKDEVVFKSIGEPFGEFHHIANGFTNFCIINGSRDGKKKNVNTEDGIERTVGFNIRVIPDAERGMSEPGPEEEKTAKIMKEVSILQERLDHISDIQDYFRTRERFHFDTTRATYEGTISWSLIEALILVVISACQVLYLRKFFERKRFL